MEMVFRVDAGMAWLMQKASARARIYLFLQLIIVIIPFYSIIHAKARCRVSQKASV